MDHIKELISRGSKAAKRAERTLSRADLAEALFCFSMANMAMEFKEQLVEIGRPQTLKEGNHVLRG